MKKIFFKCVLATLLGFGLLSGVQSAPVAPTTPYAVYNYTANCIDCAQALEAESREVSGTLTLQSYVPGGAVSAANFYALSYDGSNLFSAFSVFGSDVINVDGFNLTSGAFPTQGNDAPADFYVTFQTLLNPGDEGLTQIFFRSRSDSSFELGFGNGSGGDNDNGLELVYTLTRFVPASNPTNDIPEPGSLLLVGAALAAIALARRRRSD